MSEKIDKVIQRIEDDISKENTPTLSNGEDPSVEERAVGADPKCSLCGGVGYIREDHPVGHPQFGKIFPCVCLQQQINLQVHQHLYSLSNLNQLRSLTFENFKPRGQIGLSPALAGSLESAYNQAVHFSKTLKGWLVIQGNYGTGKTHLAAAIANHVAALGIPTLFITVPDLLDNLRASYHNPDATFESRFEQIRNAKLLILDDFGTQNATAWAQEKLFQIINFRYINRLPLVVTTNLSLQEIEGRIQSRLVDPNLVTISRILAPDYRRPVDDSGHPDLSNLDLHTDQTFGNFSLRKNEGLPLEDVKSIEKAFRASRAFAETPEGWLVFIGSYGCGKTHLAAAIANYRAGVGYPPIFTAVPDLLDHLRSTFSPTSTISYDRRFESVRNTPLLILDDLGTQNMTPWVQEKLHQLLNHRYSAKLPTIITSANRIEEIDDRLRSRLLDTRLCTIYAITMPTYQGRPRKSGRQR